MSSNLRVDIISDRSGNKPASLLGQSAAKAWIKHQEVVPTTVLAGFNVSSVTSFGSGFFGLNFTNSMLTDQYCAVCSATITGGPNIGGHTTSASTASQARLNASNTSGGGVAQSIFTAQIAGDLA